jgi:hypothetical protein
MSGWRKKMRVFGMSEGTRVDRRGVVAKVGTPIPASTNAPRLYPVGFEDGTYAVLLEHGRPLVWFGKGSRGLNRAIKNSSVMPEVATLATGVIRIYIQDKNGRKGIIRYHYGMGKEDREDYVMWA